MRKRIIKKEPVRSPSRLPTSTPSASPTMQPHTEWNGQPATGYAPLRMPVDTDQMETASTTTRSNKSNTRSIDDMIR